MKTKTILYFSIILLLLTSCNNKNKDIEGVWISAYQLNEENFNYFIPKIVKIEQNTLKYKTVDIIDSNQKTYYYSMKNGIFYANYDNYLDTIKVELISKDSLILNIYKKNYVFKKLKAESTIFKKDIIGNIYYIKGEYYEDTFDFINENSFLAYSDRNSRKSKWDLISYNSYNLICIANTIEQPCFLIEKLDSSGTIKTNLFYKEDITYDFKKLTLQKLNKTLLQGEWNFIKKFSADVKAPPPPPSFYNPIYTFKENLIQKTYNDSLLWESNFELSSKNDIIFFYEDKNPWQIIELTEEKMKVITNINYHEQYDTLEFWKQ